MLVQRIRRRQNPFSKTQWSISSIALAIVVLAVGWILVSRWMENRVLKGEPRKSEL